jgi:cell division protein ZapA (FtsZ GTPase activity inhibitor)
MIDKIIEIEVYGRPYKIRVKGEEDEKYVNHLTSYVDQKMQEIAVKSKSTDALKIAVLALLNIADDSLGQMETEIESLESRLLKDDHAYPNIDNSTP